MMERIAIIRTEAITQEVAKQLINDKKVSKKEREDMYVVAFVYLPWYFYSIRQKTKDVSDYESTTFSIFYINAIFILILMISSTIFHQLSDPM